MLVQFQNGIIKKCLIKWKYLFSQNLREIPHLVRCGSVRRYGLPFRRVCSFTSDLVVAQKGAAAYIWHLWWIIVARIRYGWGAFGWYCHHRQQEVCSRGWNFRSLTCSRFRRRHCPEIYCWFNILIHFDIFMLYFYTNKEYAITHLNVITQYSVK